ncbi:cation efflux system protein, AcrB/AcrD/AcrF family protein [Anopheles sinensis]|uniref:Cation efflux system protein, AcrB/AcrD/AcrF family protein n=1 Tax=Anopheles sinensis TaxID=74873 RepID=A0A084VZX5_ANOSI|nr:cation efflux system protein, AcrB/AcrD/AcrF family protein [Anopheles sinensis]
MPGGCDESPTVTSNLGPGRQQFQQKQHVFQRLPPSARDEALNEVHVNQTNKHTHPHTLSYVHPRDQPTRESERTNRLKSKYCTKCKRHLPLLDEFIFQFVGQERGGFSGNRVAGFPVLAPMAVNIVAAPLMGGVIFIIWQRTAAYQTENGSGLWGCKRKWGAWWGERFHLGTTFKRYRRANGIRGLWLGCSQMQ